MFCYNCGKELNDDFNLCPYCGADITRYSDETADKAKEYIVETKKPEKSRQKAAGCRNTQEVIYTQPLFITPFYLLKGYRSDRLDINIPVIPKAARRDGFTR